MRFNASELLINKIHGPHGCMHRARVLTHWSSPELKEETFQFLLKYTSKGQICIHLRRASHQVDILKGRYNNNIDKVKISK